MGVCMYAYMCVGVCRYLCTYIPYSWIYWQECLADCYIEKGRKLQLADIKLAVTIRSPCLLRESTRLAQYWWI